VGEEVELVRSTARTAVISAVATAVAELARPPRRRVAVDGVDGAGKTRFADELAAALTRCRVPVVRASVDGFHHPREVRHRRGRNSPEGYVQDSYDYEALHRELLDPFAPGGDGRHRVAVHDVGAEAPLALPVRGAPHDAVLVLDGIFLHRDQLRGRWDLSVFLDVPTTVSIERCASRDGTDPDPAAASNRRYVEGQRRYLVAARPADVATFVIDNTDLARPVLRRSDRLSGM
jgi:uridine kinase